MLTLADSYGATFHDSCESAPVDSRRKSQKTAVISAAMILPVFWDTSGKESHSPKLLQTNKQSSVLEIIFFSNVVNFISNENFTVLFKTKGETGK